MIEEEILDSVSTLGGKKKTKKFLPFIILGGGLGAVFYIMNKNKSVSNVQTTTQNDMQSSEEIATDIAGIYQDQQSQLEGLSQQLSTSINSIQADLINSNADLQQKLIQQSAETNQKIQEQSQQTNAQINDVKSYVVSEAGNKVQEAEPKKTLSQKLVSDENKQFKQDIIEATLRGDTETANQISIQAHDYFYNN